MKGAFTGAIAIRRACLRRRPVELSSWMKSAEMSPAMQVKLLRALQDKKIRRVGGTEEIFI